MLNSFSRVCIVGLGYIGLPTAAVLASKGIEVIGVDIRQDIVDTVNSGSIHIVEPGLGELVKSVVNSNYLRASTSPESCDAFIIAVPTPFFNKPELAYPLPDLSYIEVAAKSISKFLKQGDLIVLESTSPVGATEKLSEWLAELRPDLTFPHSGNQSADILIAYCPERVLPGNVLSELVRNDRIIGGLTQKCSQRAAALYEIFVEGHCHISSARIAELCKLAENSFRDVNIAFANELSLICDDLGIDVWELVRLANHHPRVNILRPGPGVGGHCIAVDPWFIVASSPALSKLISTARSVNDAKPDWVIRKTVDAISMHLSMHSYLSPQNIKVAFFGLTFKPDIDDLRESPSLDIVTRISISHPGSILVVEPNISCLPGNLNLPNISFVDKKIALESADILVFLVRHSEFSSLDFSSIQNYRIIDCCGMFI